MLVVVSMFLAAGLNPVVEFLERRGLTPAVGRPRGDRRGVIAALALFVVAIVPVITDQVARSPTTRPRWLDELQRNRQVQELDQEYDIIDKVQDYVATVTSPAPSSAAPSASGWRSSSALLNAFIVIVLTLYFLASLQTTKNAIYRLAPASRRDRVTKLGDRWSDSVGGYVSGAFVVAMCAGISSLIFLFVVGLGEYAVALAFVVALLDVIPMIGATIGAVIVTAIAFATDSRSASPARSST